MDSPDPSLWIGQVIPHSYKPGFIVLSYLVSLSGCWTTLELLHRRTSARGYYNWYLLIAAALVMGAVGVWCMHFIGNIAIIMDHGRAGLQIQYSPGPTTGSFLLPIVGLTIAFYILSTSESVSVLGTLIGGVLTGIAVCGMHYMSQIGLANYSASYNLAYVFGSALIAIFASTAALGIFFYFTATWTDSWLKRGLCASLLAASVSGMHWVGTVGCEYRLKSSTGYTMVGLSRQATAIVVICLSVGCCVTLMVLALIGQRSRRLSADRAQQVVLACATFDLEGRLMVTPEGLLPSRKITDSYAERSFDEIFDIEHPVFCWIYKASRCWSTISDLLPAIRTHLHSTVRGFVDDRTSSSADQADDYSTTFKELFCIAANDLATTTQTPFEHVGVLFEGIMSTGTLGKNANWKRLHRLWKPNSLDSVERGQSPTTFGRGQLLFVIRRVNRFESTRLQATGHRFATISNVTDYLARSMEVTPDELLPQLEKMREYAEAERFLEPGVHLACFALRPVFHRGFDILVRRDFGYMLPTTLLSSTKLEGWQLNIVHQMDNWTVASCCETLRGRSMVTDDQNERPFVRQLLEAITALARNIERTFFQDARLIARLFRAPSSGCKESPTDAFVLAFRIITDVHQSHELVDEYEFAPSKFFLVQQHAFRDSPDNQIFARRIHREFAAVAESQEVPPRYSCHRTMDRRLSSVRRSRSRSASPGKSSRWPARTHSSGTLATNDNASDHSEKILVGPTPKSFSGIHVSNEVSVDVSELTSGGACPGVELTTIPLGFSTEAGVGDVETESFADELMVATTDERRRQRSGLSV